VLLQVTPFIQPALQEVLQFIHAMNTGSAPTPDTWAHVEVEFQFVGNLESADRWFTSFDFINITGGAVDSSWNTNDHDTVQAGLDAIAAAYLGLAPSTVQYVGARHYMRAFSDLPTAPIPPGEHDKPFLKSGPPAAVYSRSQFGTVDSVTMPPQNAISVTEKTPYRKHWGRFYLPQLDHASITSTGHIVSTACTSLANVVGTQYGLLQNAEFFPVVPVTQIERAPARALLTVNQVQVDDVPDVIRRRRPRQTTFRAVDPPGPIVVI